jgi:NTP pyrophosphatase (non-canonical NTP hydrolase)
MSIGVIERFSRYENPMAFTKEDGDLLAIVSFVRGSWGWVLYRKGECLMGARSFHADACQACSAAELAIAEVKVAEDAKAAGVPQTVPGEVSRDPRPGEVYRHCSGGVYEIEDRLTDSVSGTEIVVARLQGSKTQSRWTLRDFNEPIMFGGVLVDRFSKMSEATPQAVPGVAVVQLEEGWRHEQHVKEDRPAVPMTFSGFSAANRARCESPEGFGHALDSWSLSDWFTATMGELGEAANNAKKLNRVRDGIKGNTVAEAELRAKLRNEIADTFIYLDLLAQSAGINLEDAVRDTFDAKSAEIGYGKRLGG